MLMLFKCKQQAGAMLPSDCLPRKACERTFQRPQKIEAGVGTCLFSTRIGGNGANFPKLRDGRDASQSKHVL